MAKQLREFSREEVSKHNKHDDLWIIVDAKVYDITRFSKLHPGGLFVLQHEDVAGKDATEAFFSLHRHEVLHRPQYARLQIGTLAGEKSAIQSASADASAVPYAEPSWLVRGFHSPYYSENHRAFQKAMRKFFVEVILPDAEACEESGKRASQHVLDKMGEMNIHAMRLGPGKHLKGLSLMGGLVKPEEFDYFHELIITSELGRLGTRSYFDGLLAGGVIGLPPVLNYGSKELRAKVVPDILRGKKFISLAISEAFAGSDVQGLQTIARKEGNEWVINGTKKWITNGTFSDWFTTGCKTDNGFTVILVPRCEGVETRPIKTSYSSTAGTAFVTFDNVRVPIANTLGAEGKGLNVILSNFNHERWMMCCISVRCQRFIVEECLKWAQQRQVFGKPLLTQAVIRSKLAQMIARVESCHNWLEHVTYQMNNSYSELADKMAGNIGLLKMTVSRMARETAEDATQIFGGRGITVTGMGKYIENYHRGSPFDAILGGAEDVLGDLGVRQALRRMPRDVRL